jgi:putative colanic acid biosynthesis acetyltransferase WcaF
MSAAESGARHPQRPDTPVERDRRYRFSLAAFPGYDKGRSFLWQVTWLAALELFFKRWWLPSRLRPPMLRLFGAEVGQRVYVRDGVHLTWPWHITIGDDVWIGRGVQMLTSTHITIGHDVCISQGAMLMTSGHDPSSGDFKVYDFPIKVGNHVWICARAMVLHGVRLPDHTVVNANGVVRFGQPVPYADAGP